MANRKQQPTTTTIAYICNDVFFVSSKFPEINYVTIPNQANTCVLIFESDNAEVDNLYVLLFGKVNPTTNLGLKAEYGVQSR